MLRVVVVDDHPVYREGLRLALEPDVDVVGEAADADSAVSVVAEVQPDVVLMDLQLGGASGIEATRRIAADHPEVAVLVLTMSEDDATVHAALRAGAKGYLLKEATSRDIVRGIHSVSRGEAVLGAGVSERLLARLSGAAPAGAVEPLPQLTPKEREVLDLVARGLDNTAIAAKLFLSEKTVRNRVSLILDKLPAANRAEAVAKARDAGLGR